MNPQTIPYDQPTSSPTPKVAAVGATGAIVTALVFVLARFNIVVPQEISDAVVTLVVAASALLQFLAGYLKRDEKPPTVVQEIIKEDVYFKG